MAYGTKYRFRFQSDGDTAYEVRLLENGYSGSVTDRPLGKSPVIKMQESDPFLPTSCDLVLECQTDGEYVDLYTTDPFQYMVEVYIWEHGQYTPYTRIWHGFVATELYSEPDIAPPYDVRITATDGLGILKEYDFEASGPMSVREHLYWLLKKAGDEYPAIFTASQLREYGGTAANFLDNVKIDLDYMVGKNCYEALSELLTTLRCVLTYQGIRWVVVRKTDAQISSTGMLSCLYSDPDRSQATTTDSLPVGFTVGQMGVAELWPVGYLTRRVEPAKKTVTVRAPWHWKNGAPSVKDGSWTLTEYGEFVSAGGYYRLGTDSYVLERSQGRLSASMVLKRFTSNFKVSVKASCNLFYSSSTTGVKPGVRIYAAWTNLSTGTVYYFDPSRGWSTSSLDGDKLEIYNMNPDHDINAASEVSVDIPACGQDTEGWLTINVVGTHVDVYDIAVEPSGSKGYQDVILIDNGARGKAQDIEISGGRVLSGSLMSIDFMMGVFFRNSGDSDGDVLSAFSDGSNTNKDFMSLTALAYAKEYAAPKIEITGTLNNDNLVTYGHPPLFIKSHGVWAMVSSFEWDMKQEDIRFTAVTLPTVTLAVDSEEITSIPNN